MAYKVHFRATKGGLPVCAVGQADASGRVMPNRRDKCRSIPSEFVVGADEFRATLSHERCAHCEGLFTDRINKRRAKAGLPLYWDAFQRKLMS